MPILNPQQNWVDWWEYRLWASAGQHNYEVVLYKDNSAEIMINYAIMGQPKHRYHLYGEHNKISGDYGLISIKQIKKMSPTQTNDIEEINIQDFEDGILFEYFRVVRSPHFQHPQDMLEMAKAFGSAGWQEYFDVYLVLSPFVEELIESLHYAHENPSEDYPIPNIETVEVVAELIKMLDKRKFEKLGIKS